VSHSTRRWRSTLKWQRQSGLVIFIYSPCDSSGALCLMMLHRVSLVPSLDRGWITATLCIMACQTTIFKGYSECRMLPQELFAKLHDANITQPTFLRISIGYRCVAESTTRLPSSVTKPSNCNNLRILLVYSCHTDSREFWGHLRQTYCQHSLH